MIRGMAMLLMGRTGQTLLMIIGLVICMAYVSMLLLERLEVAEEAGAKHAVELDSSARRIRDVARLGEWRTRISAATLSGELDAIAHAVNAQGARYTHLTEDKVEDAGGLGKLFDNLTRFINLRREWIEAEDRRRRIAGRLILLDRDMERHLVDSGILEVRLAERWRTAFEEAVATLLKVDQVKGRSRLDNARRRFIEAFEEIEGMTLEHPGKITPEMDLSVAELVEYGLGGEDNLIVLGHRLLDLEEEWRLLEARNRILVDGVNDQLDQDWRTAQRQAALLGAEAKSRGEILRLWLMLSPALLLLFLGLAYVRLWRIWRMDEERKDR